MTNDRRFARLTFFLHTLSPAPSTLVIPYTEPFFALLSFSGSSLLEQEHRWLAAVCWMGMTWFRQLGVLNAGFFVWDWLCEARSNRGRRPTVRMQVAASGVDADFGVQALVLSFLRTILLVAMVIAPFAHAQRDAYLRFCVDALTSRPWCDRRLPFAYTWAQEHYWSVARR